MRRLIGFVVLLILWQLGAQAVQSPLFPPISEVFQALVGLLVTGEAWRHVVASLCHVLCGFAIAVALGTILGIGVTQSYTLDLTLGPVIDAMRPVAALTIFPLLILALGLGLWSKVFVIFWTSWPAVLLNTAQGLHKVDRSVIEAAQLDGAGCWPLLWHVSLPLALPMIMTGLRIGLSGGWISLVSAEMLGSSAGLGYAILAYSQTFRFPQMYAVIILIAWIGLCMNVALAWLQNLLDYDYDKEVSNESPFIRYHDRAASFVLDSTRWLRSPRNP